jgi:rare lipoprotein A
MPFVRQQFGLVVLVLVLLGAIACGGKKAPTTPPDIERYSDKGIASWYGRKFHGKRTASGERFDMYALTAAHRTFPFGSIVQVTDLENGRSVRVRINDRGPFKSGRIIDLSYAAARELRIVKRGVVRVKITLVGHMRIPAHRDQRFRAKVITHFGDHDRGFRAS